MRPGEKIILNDGQTATIVVNNPSRYQNIIIVRVENTNSHESELRVIDKRNKKLVFRANKKHSR
ncbi:hypothetical protein [Lactococcus taiwanensis]|uniref:hypothetical protein n=1 Tax=Lactococcus taiwanensis TaxID=1151742 RepID=UPI0019654507|nr:hypothetical protein [Lactococcus taiwanensis]QRZ11593.1 hypothetical protein JVB21_02815 [Lactococcus taiwanensis]